MKTKRIVPLLLVGMFVMMAAFQSHADSKFPLKEWPRGVICGGGSPGGAYYNSMVAISELSQKHLKVRGTAIATAPGSSAGIQGINRKELDFAPLLDQFVVWSIESKGPFQGRPPIKSVRAVAGSHLLLYGLVTTARADIKSMEDLRGTGYTISIHPAGSTTLSLWADTILEFYNLGPDDVRVVPHTGVGEVVAGLKEGRFRVAADALYASVSMPWTLELDRDLDLRMIPLSKECVEYVLKKVEGTLPGVIPPGLYRGVQDNIDTIGVAAGIFCREDLPESLIYELTKLIFNEPTRAEFLNFGAHHKEYTIESIKDLRTPVHSGALKFYKEKGVWDATLEERRKEMLSKMDMDN